MPNQRLAVLFLADLHLTDRPGDEYRWAVCKWVVEKCKAFPIGEVVIMGDLTHFKDNHSSRLVNRIMSDLINPILQLGVPITIVQGNHDYTDPDMPFFGWLNYVNGVQWIGEATRTKLISGDVAFVVPHTNKATQLIIADIKKMLEVDPAPTFVFFHHAFFGAKLPYGRTIDQVHGLPMSILEMFPPTTVILSGDIHNAQQLGRLTYIGSPHPVVFGENHNPRALLHEPGKPIVQLAIPSLKRWHIELEGLARVMDFDTKPQEWPDVRTGDHIKFTITLDRTEYAEWSTVRDGLAEVATARGLILHGIELKPKEQSETKPGKVDLGLTIGQVFNQFCLEKSVPAEIREVGLELAGIVESKS